MKHILLGTLLIAISIVIAWNSTEWSCGVLPRESWLAIIAFATFFVGFFLILLGLAKKYRL